MFFSPLKWKKIFMMNLMMIFFLLININFIKNKLKMKNNNKLI